MYESSKKEMIIVFIFAFLIAIFIIVSAIQSEKDDAMPTATPDEVIQASTSTLVVENNAVEKYEFDKSINQQAIYEDYVETLQMAETLSITNKDLVEDLTENQLAIIKDLNLLKTGNEEVVLRYFGESDAFTPAIVADRTAPAKIHFIINPTNSNYLYAHICTLDYQKMMTDYVTDAKADIPLKILQGKYDICYTVPVAVKDDSVQISEALKEAITGGWYVSDAEPTSCIIG